MTQHFSDDGPILCHSPSLKGWRWQ